MNWHSKTLGVLTSEGVITSVSGYSSGEHNNKGIGIPHVRPFNVSPDGRIDLTEKKYVPPTRHKLTLSLRRNDIVFNNTNSAELVGKTALWRDDGGFGFSNHMTRIRVTNSDVLAAPFLAYYLHEFWLRGECRMICRQHVAQASIIGDRFFQIPVSIPPKPEQEKIAAVLWKVQRAIATQDRLIAATRDLKASAMQRLFTRGLHNEPLKDTEIGLMPENWRLMRCEDATRSITVGVVVKPASHYVTEGVPAFRSFNIREDLLDDRDLVFFSPTANDSILSKSKLSTGDVLVVRTGYPGTSCVVPPEYDGANCIDLVIVKPNPECAVPEYLSRFFNSHVGRAQTTASSYGLAQQHLNVGAVKRIWLALPSIDEQRAIAATLIAIDRKLAYHQKKRAALNDLFQTLLHQLMTAELRVNHLDIDTREIVQPATQGETA